jgi:hypothetical protein
MLVLALPADAKAAGFRVSGHAQVQGRLDHSVSFAAAVILGELSMVAQASEFPTGPNWRDLTRW